MKRISIKLKFQDSPNELSVPTVSVKQFEETLCICLNICTSLTVFQQGEEGKSWYIILRGSVDVAIHGRGVVTTLHEGEDFGKLALINDAPR